MSLFGLDWKRELKKHLETMSAEHYPVITDIIAKNNEPVELTYDNCRFDAKISKNGEEKQLYNVTKNDEGKTLININPEFYGTFKKVFEKISDK